jgi:thiol-disulfide isomerase/thioredoxin
VAELDFNELGFPGKIPAMTLPGIYKVDGDHLTACFHTDPDLKRPTEFAATGKKAVVLKLGRAGPKFKDHPTEVTVTVTGPDGKPVPKATTFAFMAQNHARDPKDGPREWHYVRSFPTGPDGTARVPYEEIAQGVRARVADRKLIGYAPASPFTLQSAALTVKLEPEVRLTGTVVSADLKKAGQPVGWTNTQLFVRGNRIADYMTPDGKFEFPVPPGDYVLEAYGTDLHTKKVAVTVPAGRDEFAVPPIDLTASAIALLKGKPAPELKAVVGWKGEPVTLAGLKGKYVLLEFWGYWCSPCVASMPVLLELHDKFKDMGLAVVGVHLDADGEVDTAAKLDEKLVDIRKKLWKDRDLPFPVALCSGKEVDVGGGEMRRGGPPLQYGVLAYPTTILIDRDGKVVGHFHARDAAAAVKAVEKLLAKK